MSKDTEIGLKAVRGRFFVKVSTWMFLFALFFAHLTKGKNIHRTLHPVNENIEKNSIFYSDPLNFPRKVSDPLKKNDQPLTTSKLFSKRNIFCRINKRCI